MASVYRAADVSQDFEEWLGSGIIEDVRFLVTDKAVDVHFQDSSLYVRIHFSSGYMFTGEIEVKNSKKPISGQIVFEDEHVDLLVFILNIFETDRTDGFMRACSDAIREVWESKDDDT